MSERQWIFKSLIGSENYNLNVDSFVHESGIVFPSSDKDYKQFILPTFDDLYHGDMYSKKVLSDIEDIDIHDIRKLPMLFRKANINYLESLFSIETTINESNLQREQINLLNEIFKRKDDIARMNLQYLFRTCRGMQRTKMSILEKGGTESTQHLVKAFGYDTKNALHAYRVDDFLVRFRENGFSDFKGAIEYNDEERHFMLGIKHGKYSLEEFRELIEDFDNYVGDYESKYYEDLGLDEKLDNEIKEIVKELVEVSLYPQNH